MNAIGKPHTTSTTSTTTQFQLKTKNVFLTYPQCDVPLQGLMAFLSKLGPTYIVVSSELHEDGSLHRHAYMQFDKPIRTRDKRYFDFNGFHPNIQGARNPSAVLSYVKKGGDFLENGVWLDQSKAGKKESLSENEIMSKAKECDFAQFLCWASVNKVQYAKDIWTAVRHVDVNTITSDEGLSRIMDPRFKRLLMNIQPTLNTDYRPIVMVGASGIGKTNIAKLWAPKPCLFVNHIDILKEFKAGYHKSIIFFPFYAP